MVHVSPSGFHPFFLYEHGALTGLDPTPQTSPRLSGAKVLSVWRATSELRKAPGALGIRLFRLVTRASLAKTHHVGTIFKFLVKLLIVMFPCRQQGALFS